MSSLVAVRRDGIGETRELCAARRRAIVVARLS